MKDLKIVVVGAGGRMGREILALIDQDSDCAFVGGVDRSGNNASSISEVDANETDGIIDFSSPEVFSSVLSWCTKNGKPLVSGTTGLSSSQFQDLSKSAQSIPLLWAPNMSLGVAVVNEMLKLFRQIPQFDYQIEEFHHNRKKDRPSGTALHLQKTLEEALGRKLPEALAIRGGGIFGVHKTWAMSDEEVISVEHTALNRSVFARGSIQALKWLVKQQPGQYHMTDVLGF